MDILRNVGIREPIPQGTSKITDTDINTLAMKINDPKICRSSLPNISLKEMENVIQNTANEPITTTTATTNKIDIATKVDARCDLLAQTLKANEILDDDVEECAISGRLEIRVIQQSHDQQHKSSPNREESVYFDAITGQASTNADDTKVSRKLANKININIERNLNPSNDSNENADGYNEQPTDETAFFSTTTTGRMFDSRDEIQSHAQKLSGVSRINVSGDSNPNSADGDNRATSINDNDDNAIDTFVSAATTLAKLSNVMDNNEANATNTALQLCNANDSLSTNKEFPVVSYSLYPNQTTATTLDQTINKTITTTIKPITDQSDDLATANVSNSNSNPNNQNIDKKDTNNSISTINNSSQSKIPVLNPNARTAKCASWAGNDLPITPNDLNDLTPGNKRLTNNFNASISTSSIFSILINSH